MKILVYTRENCPYCDKIKMVFKAKCWEYVEYKLDRDFTREEFLEKFPTESTFPRVFIDDLLIGGCSETVQYLKENNLV